MLRVCKITLIVTSLLSASIINSEAAGIVSTDTFDGFSLDFVDIGNAGNVGETYQDKNQLSFTFGSVAYEYRMGVNEISSAMINAYNAAETSTIQYINGGGDVAARGLTWASASRFVNWLNTSQGYQAAYNPGYPYIWDSSEAWQLGGENLYRHKDAKYFLPSENEWYKAAYYDPSTNTYFDYATGSDTAPIPVASGTTAGTAVFDQNLGGFPALVYNAGGLSPYGTMAQSGNVSEYMESARDGVNDSRTEQRVIRGGTHFHDPQLLKSDFRVSADYNTYISDVGFRVASVSMTLIPEPSSSALLGLGGLALTMRRKRI
jgi:hypothetical protein